MAEVSAVDRADFGAEADENQGCSRRTGDQIVEDQGRSQESSKDQDYSSR